MGDLPFKLRAGEEILLEIKPQPQLRNYFKMQTFLPLSFVLLFTVFGIILIPFVYLLAIWTSEKCYEQRIYWITNKRVIYKRGFIGYKITSIPYNRISDVIISRTWFENLFKISSLNIQTLAGQISQSTGGAEGNLAGVPNPEELQEVILDNMEKSSM